MISKKSYTIGTFAKMTSTTERTLRFYDHKGLLKPSGYNEQGHRTYSDEDLLRLHQILTLKYLDYSLDEIGKYLEQDGKDFNASLEMQYEMLLQKQQHIQRVLTTIERVSAIVKDNLTIDPSLIMLMIHSIQHEEEQKRWLAERLPDSVVNSFFMSGLSSEERLQIERGMTLWLNDLLDMYKQGLQPNHLLVQERALDLKQIIEPQLGEGLEELGTSEVGKALEEMDMQFYPSNFDPDFKNYLHEAFGYLSTRTHNEPESE